MKKIKTIVKNTDVGSATRVVSVKSVQQPETPVVSVKLETPVKSIEDLQKLIVVAMDGLFLLQQTVPEKKSERTAAMNGLKKAEFWLKQ